MKIVKRQMNVTVELTWDDMVGLVKLIGPTSKNDRERYMTKEQSEALGHVHGLLSDLTGEC